MSGFFSRHSRLYFRNTLLVIVFSVGAFSAAIYSPSRWETTLWFVPVVYLNYLLWQLYLSTHPARLRQPRLTPLEATLPYEDVSLQTEDGLRIAGWYVPGKNRAAVILVHGLGGSKVLMLNHARALAFDGYGALMIDLRAHGASTGDTVDGIHERYDVEAGVKYLLGREDVDADKIGAVGVSLGAVTVLHAARHNDAIRAMVLDGMGPICLDDHGGPPVTLKRKVNAVINRIFYGLGNWFSGEPVEEGVRAALAHLWPRPVLLIATGRGYEMHFNRLFLAAANGPKDLWEVRHARHAEASLREPLEYRERLRKFFKKSLLGG